MVHLQDARRYVSNPDGILSETTVYAIDTTLYALERETGIQTLVVAVGQIEGGDCFDFAYRLGRENGVGRKETDNGLVILLVTGERCIQFATGYGLEGDLPDAICKRIQVRYMNPHFSKDEWDAGMLEGVRGACPVERDRQSRSLFRRRKRHAALVRHFLLLLHPRPPVLMVQRQAAQTMPAMP